MILSDQSINGTARKLLTHFDRNGLGYTLDRATGELLVAEKYDPKVNWTSGVDMDKNSPTYGRPKVLDQYSTDKQGEDHNHFRLRSDDPWIGLTIKAPSTAS